MEDELKNYAYLWTTEKQQWVLLADEESQQKKDYMPYHIKSWRFLTIEDVALRRAIIEKMIEAGVQQVTDEQIFGR